MCPHPGERKEQTTLFNLGTRPLLCLYSLTQNPMTKHEIDCKCFNSRVPFYMRSLRLLFQSILQFPVKLWSLLIKIRQSHTENITLRGGKVWENSIFSHLYHV